MKRQLFCNEIDSALTRISLSCGKFHMKLDMWNCIVGGFVVVFVNGKHDFNYWLDISQPPRKIHELLWTSCDLAQFIQSQKPVLS